MNPPQVPRWLRALVAFLCLANLYFLRFATPNVWWHLEVGQWIAQNQAVPREDPFSYIRPLRPWIDHEWLFNLLLYLSYAALGPAGMVLFKMAIGAGLLAFLEKEVRRRALSPEVYALSLVLPFTLLGRYFEFRPQIITYLGLAATLLVLEQGLRQGRIRRLGLLPLLFALWANLHGGFPIGVGVAALYLLLFAFRPAKERTRLKIGWVAWAVGLVATLLTPYTYRLWLYIPQDVLYAHRGIEEWRSLRLRPLGLEDALLLMLLWLWGLGFLLRWRRWEERDAIAFLLALAGMRSLRHAPLFAVAAVLSLPASLGWVEERLSRSGRRALLGLTWLPGFMVLLLTCQNPLPRIWVADQSMGGFPAQAVAFIKANRLFGNLYNDMNWGGYLLWELYPLCRVAMDGRYLTVYPPEVIEENIAFFHSPNPDLEAPLRYPTDLVMGPPSSVAMQRLAASPRWCVLYRDERAMLLTPRDEAHREWVERARRREWQRPRDSVPFELR